MKKILVHVVKFCFSLLLPTVDESVTEDINVGVCVSCGGARVLSVFFR